MKPPSSLESILGLNVDDRRKLVEENKLIAGMIADFIEQTCLKFLSLTPVQQVENLPTRKPKAKKRAKKAAKSKKLSISARKRWRAVKAAGGNSLKHPPKKKKAAK